MVRSLWLVPFIRYVFNSGMGMIARRRGSVCYVTWEMFVCIQRLFVDEECESKAWKITKPRASKGKDAIVPGEAVAMGLVSAADYEALQGWLAR